MRLLPHAEILLMMERVGQISLGDAPSVLTVNSDADPKDERPAVYAWVADDEILYIGKAGRGVAKRMREHVNGFRNSIRGRSHAEYLAALIERGRSIALYAMWPDPVEVNGHSIPSHSAVEDWLIAVADPTPVRNLATRR